VIAAAFPYLATFCAVFALDLCWVFYIEHVKKHQGGQASLWAAFLFLTSAGATISYVDNPYLLIPATAGAFFGTLAGVERTKRALKKKVL
jgi:hypothetical protein